MTDTCWPVVTRKHITDQSPPSDDELWRIEPLLLSLRLGVISKHASRDVYFLLGAFFAHLVLFIALFVAMPQPLETPQYQEIAVEFMEDAPSAQAQAAPSEPELPLPEPAPVVVDVPAEIPAPVEAAVMTLNPSDVLVAKASDVEIAQPKPVQAVPVKPTTPVVKPQPEVKKPPVDLKKQREQREREQERREARRKQADKQRQAREAARSEVGASRAASQSQGTGQGRGSSSEAAYGAKVRAILQGRANSLGLEDVNGSVSVRFVINGSGRLASHTIGGSTGDTQADRALRSMIASSSFPSPPSGSFSGSVTIRIR
jgi:protein TonB